MMLAIASALTAICFAASAESGPSSSSNESICADIEKAKITYRTAPKTSGFFKVGKTVVTLTVTDAGGLKHKKTMTVTVNLKNGAPRPDGSDANRSFAYAAEHASNAAANGVSGDATLNGFAYASAAIIALRRRVRF